jgi:hypothetical protein
MTGIARLQESKFRFSDANFTNKKGEIMGIEIDTPVRVDAKTSNFHGLVGIVDIIGCREFPDADIRIIHPDTMRLDTITVPLSVLIPASDEDAESVKLIQRQIELNASSAVDPNTPFFTDVEEMQCSEIIDRLVECGRSIDVFLWQLKYVVFAKQKQSRQYKSFEHVCKCLYDDGQLPITPSTCHERAWAYEERRILTEDLGIDLKGIKISVHSLLEIGKEQSMDGKRELFETAFGGFAKNNKITAVNIRDAKAFIEGTGSKEIAPPPIPASKKPASPSVGSSRVEVPTFARTAVPLDYDPATGEAKTITVLPYQLDEYVNNAIAKHELEQQDRREKEAQEFQADLQRREKEFKESMIAYQISVRESAKLQAKEELNAVVNLLQREKNEALSQLEAARNEIARLQGMSGVRSLEMVSAN